MSLKYTGLAKIKYGIWVLLIVWWALVWPLGCFHLEETSKSFPDDNRQTDSILEEMPVIQEFYPKYDRLRTVAFVMNRKEGAVTEGIVHVKLYDAKIRLLWEQDIPMDEVTDNGFTEVTVNQKVKQGALYYLRLEVNGLQEEAPVLAYRSLLEDGPTENGDLHYGGTVVEDGSAVTRYEYGKPLGLPQILTFDALGLFVGILLMHIVDWLIEKKAGKSNETKTKG